MSFTDIPTRISIDWTGSGWLARRVYAATGETVKVCGHATGHRSEDGAVHCLVNAYLFPGRNQ